MRAESPWRASCCYSSVTLAEYDEYICQSDWHRATRCGAHMNIVVLMKQVPDTEGDRKLASDNTVDRAAVDPVINYIDEFAIEEGLRLKEAHDGEVTILTVGPERATESIRKALSMGADKAVHVCDDALHGSDAVATAKILAKALGTLEWDLVTAGPGAPGAGAAFFPPFPAGVPGVPQLTKPRKLPGEVS